MLKTFAAMRQKAAWWASAMSGSARDPEITRELSDYEPLLNSLTLEDVKSAAAQWLSSKPIVGVAFPRSASEASLRTIRDSRPETRNDGGAKR